MKKLVFSLFSSAILASCGGLSSLGLKDVKEAGRDLAPAEAGNQEPALGTTQGDTGSLAFDLSGVVAESDKTSLSLTSLPRPEPLYGRFEFDVSGKNGNSEWAKKFSFSADQKEVLLSGLPVGPVKVSLTAFDPAGVAIKSATADTAVQALQVTRLTLVLKKISGNNDTGSIDIQVVDEPTDYCASGPRILPLCALPAGYEPVNKICTVTISGKQLTTKVGWCAPQQEFQNWLCAQGVRLTEADRASITCKDEPRVCTAIAGNLYSTKDASVVPFNNGCERSDLLRLGAAVHLDQIPRLFSKGEICTQVMSKWKHPKSGEIAGASDGCQAAGLASLGFTPVPN